MTSRDKCGRSGAGSALYYQVLTLVTFAKSVSPYSSACSMSQGSGHGLHFCGQVKNERVVRTRWVNMHFLSYCNNENIRYGKVIEEVIERNKNEV